MNTQLDQLESELAKFDQTHLLRFWDAIDESQRRSLVGQIKDFDLELIERLFRSHDDEAKWAKLAAQAKSPPAITLADFENQESHRQAIRIGSDALAAGKVAMILVAGGQGSRLGFDHPKGMFPIGPVSNRSLYQMMIDLLRAERLSLALGFRCTS